MDANFSMFFCMFVCVRVCMCVVYVFSVRLGLVGLCSGYGLCCLELEAWDAFGAVT